MNLEQAIAELTAKIDKSHAEASELWMLEGHNEGVGFRFDAEAQDAYTSKLVAERDQLLTGLFLPEKMADKHIPEEMSLGAFETIDGWFTQLTPKGALVAFQKGLTPEMIGIPIDSPLWGELHD
jgi:hypothetical protein